MPSNLVEHAREELARAGLFDADGDYAGKLGADVVALLEAFSAQGHSGESGQSAAALFAALVQFRPLTSLTGADDEWEDRGEGLQQNRRCPSVFRRADGTAFDVDRQKAPVTFPYAVPQS